MPDDATPLTPAPEPPDEHYSSIVRVRIGRRRFELRVAVEAREITRGPADVIEWPERPEMPSDSAPSSS